MGVGNGMGRVPLAEPLDLPQIRQWLGRLASDSADPAASDRRSFFRKTHKTAPSHEDELTALDANLAGLLGRSRAEDVLRRLLALGTVQFVKAVGRIPTDAAAADVVMDVAAFALWSIVQAPALPADWQAALARLSSPRMADLVAQARDADAARKAENFTVFVQVLASRPPSLGVRNLLDDLSDQRRGGAALVALALAAGLPEPDPRKREKAAATWLFTALLGGALGAEGSNLATAVNRLTEEAWDWVTDSVDPAASTPHFASHKSVLAEEFIHSLFH